MTLTSDEVTWFLLLASLGVSLVTGLYCFEAWREDGFKIRRS